MLCVICSAFSNWLRHCVSTEYRGRDYENSHRKRVQKLPKSQEYYVYARLPRCRLINAAGTATGQLRFPLLSFSCHRALFHHYRLRTAMAMAQSRCPLAKLKCLAFGRARIKGCTIRDSQFRFANSRQIIARSIINARLGATHARDTRNKFHTTTNQKDRKSLARFNTLFSVAWSLIFSILGAIYYTPLSAFESLLYI